MNGKDVLYFHPNWNCEAKATDARVLEGIHVVANRVSSPFTNDTISFPPSLDSPYTRSTKEIGTCQRETSVKEKTVDLTSLGFFTSTTKEDSR